MPIEITNTIKRIRLNAANQEAVINNVSCKIFQNLFLKYILHKKLGCFLRIKNSGMNNIIQNIFKNSAYI